MNQWTTPAIVLAVEPRGESDLSVRLFTPRQGRIVAVAKGALRSKKRFAGIFDLAQVVEAGLMTAPRSGRIMVEHAAVIEQFPRFREHPRRLARAALLLEIISLGAPEPAPSAALYDLLRGGLGRLHDEPDSDRFAIAYAFRMIAAMGYRPGLDCCVHCLRPWANGQALFNAAAGGVLCASCCEHEDITTGARPAAMEITPDTSRTLTEIMKAPEARISRISFTRNALTQSRRLLDLFIAHHLPRPSQVIPFMDGLDRHAIPARPGARP